MQLAQLSQGSLESITHETWTDRSRSCEHVAAIQIDHVCLNHSVVLAKQNVAGVDIRVQDMRVLQRTDDLA
jgi:hypothetical protein